MVIHFDGGACNPLANVPTQHLDLHLLSLLFKLQRASRLTRGDGDEQRQTRRVVLD